MTKSDNVINKLTNSIPDDAKTVTKNLLAGIAGGVLGALATQPLDTLSTLKQISTKKSLKQIMAKLRIKALKNLPKDATMLKRNLAVLKRYYHGIGPKILKIGPATGIALATHDYLISKNKNK